MVDTALVDLINIPGLAPVVINLIQFTKAFRQTWMHVQPVIAVRQLLLIHVQNVIQKLHNIKQDQILQTVLSVTLVVELMDHLQLIVTRKQFLLVATVISH
jgi:hypothetical protein